MSLVITKESLKREGELLLERLRDLIGEFKDFFRISLSDSFFEGIKELKEDLDIAESVAIYEQLEREGKPLGNSTFWFHRYENYIKDKTKDNKDKLIRRGPSGFFKPDLESIARILELVDIEMEIDEDLYFDIKYFLEKYKAYDHFIIVEKD